MIWYSKTFSSTSDVDAFIVQLYDNGIYTFWVDCLAGRYSVHYYSDQEIIINKTYGR